MSKTRWTSDDMAKDATKYHVQKTKSEPMKGTEFIVRIPAASNGA